VLHNKFTSVVAGREGGHWLSYAIYTRIPSTWDTGACVRPSHDAAKTQIPIAMVNCPCKYNSEFIHTQKQLLPRFQGAELVLATANYASVSQEKNTGMF